MIASNIALEIAGVFLVMGGLMYLSLSGKLGDMFRDRAPKPLLLIALIVGFAFYHWGRMLYNYADSLPPEVSAAPATPEPVSAAPKPVAHSPKKRMAAALVPAPIPETPVSRPMVVIEEEVPAAKDVTPPVAEAPPPVMPEPAADPYESKAKRGLKAVGRFLHLHKKTTPEP